MAWAGTGLVWTPAAACCRSAGWARPRAAAEATAGSFSFVQISDTPHRLQGPAEHGRGRHAPGSARADQRAAARAGVPAPHRRPDPRARSRAPSTRVTEIAQGRADASAGLLRAGRARRLRRRRQGVPERVRQGTRRAAAGRASTTAGVHFVGLVNVLNFKAGRLGSLGEDQLEWLEKDLARLAEQHAGRGLRARAALGGLPAVGLGHRGRRAGARLPASASAP